MESTIGLVLLVAFACVALWVMRSRARRVTEKRAKDEKKAKSARSDAKAIQKSLDGRR